MLLGGSDFILAISYIWSSAKIDVETWCAVLHLYIFSILNICGPSTSEPHAAVGLISEMFCKRPKPERLTWPQQKVQWRDFALAVFTTKLISCKSKHTSSHLCPAVFGISNTRMVVAVTMQEAWPPMPVQKPCRTKDRSMPMIFSASLGLARSKGVISHKPTQDNLSDGNPWLRVIHYFDVLRTCWSVTFKSVVIHDHPPHRKASRIGCTDPSR